MQTTEQYTIKIDCPNQPGHEATLYQYPHENAGIWECETCDATDACEHIETYSDSSVEDRMDFGGHYQIETPITVCSQCECVVDGYDEEDTFDRDED